MALTCVYTNPVPAYANTAAPAASTSTFNDRDRLAALESNVSRLLDLLGGSARPLVSSQPAMQDQTHLLSSGSMMEHSSSLPALADFALANESLSAISMGDWPPPIPETADTARADVSAGLAASRHVDFAVTQVSPNAPSDTAKSHRSGLSLNEAQMIDDEQYISPQARPMPKVAPASRMAVFTDSAAHEAPFRSLTFNPDTYRNEQMVGGDGPNDESRFASEAVREGGKTPKRGKGDPIDRGVFLERDARALFRDEVSFFLPICQEPMTFDTVRHRSSFLLSAILAIAAKYCCAATVPSPGSGPFGAPPDAPTSSLARHGVQPVDEQTWYRIRALAMSSYFQVLISKVHCLEDVQATLLLSAWGLHDRGASPDPWIMTGTAYRLAKRLGIHLATETLGHKKAAATARLVASWKTYLCLYAFDRFLTVGFGRPETDGFTAATLDTSLLVQYLDKGESHELGMFCSAQSAACIAAYVELANIARKYSSLVNVTLKMDPSACRDDIGRLAADLDIFSSRWLWARSSLAGKLGVSRRPVKMLYDHMRLCVHAVALKPASHPDSMRFLERSSLLGSDSAEILTSCLRKAEDSATAIIQAFSDDLRDDSDPIMCCSYDYAFMVLSHSAAVLLSLTMIGVAGVDATPSAGPGGAMRVRGIDRVTAMRYCGMAITALVESNRSVNFFSCDMAGHLSTIAKETGMAVGEWTSETVTRIIEARAAAESDSANTLGQTAADDFAFGGDLSQFGDIDLFLQPSFFDDAGLFDGSYQP